MANTIARAIGCDRTGRVKEATRLGSEYATGKAATRRTFATVTVWADGRVTLSISRDGSPVHTYTLGPEA